MAVKNSSKASEFFNKAQLLYNTNVRGEVINSKPLEAPQAVKTNKEFYDKHFTRVKAVDLGIFAITSFSERCIFF
jgi:hypothetical protein